MQMQIQKVVGKQKQEASTNAAKSGGEKQSAKEEPKNSKKQKSASGTSKKHCQLFEQYGGEVNSHYTPVASMILIAR